MLTSDMSGIVMLGERLRRRRHCCRHIGMQRRCMRVAASAMHAAAMVDLRIGE